MFIARPNRRFTLARIDDAQYFLEPDGAPSCSTRRAPWRVAARVCAPLIWNGSRDLVAWNLMHRVEARHASSAASSASCCAATCPATTGSPGRCSSSRRWPACWTTGGRCPTSTTSTPAPSTTSSRCSCRSPHRATSPSRAAARSTAGTRASRSRPRSTPTAPGSSTGWNWAAPTRCAPTATTCSTTRSGRTPRGATSGLPTCACAASWSTSTSRASSRKTCGCPRGSPSASCSCAS